MAKQITGTTALYGLLGSPVRHSRSPLMHNTAFEALGIDGVYLCFDVNEEHLAEAVRGLKAAGIRGFNVTMPCKNAMAGLCDELSPEAALMGAVNTVVNRDGQLIGYNTDGTGFLTAAREEGLYVTGETLTVLGTGGAGSAICAQAAIDGAKVLHIFSRPTSRFHSRTLALAERINSTTSCRAYLHDTGDMAALKECCRESRLLINATSVGMNPHPEECVVTDPEVFHPGLTVSDVIYDPMETTLLRLAGSRGCHTFNGMYMLLYQGAHAFRLFTGQDMPVELIRSRFFE